MWTIVCAKLTLQEVLIMPRYSRTNRILVSDARRQLDQFKYEIADELAYFEPGAERTPQDYTRALDRLKFEIAGELGIPLQDGYNGELTSRQAGAIGGRIGGPIGGNMVRRVIAVAEEELSRSDAGDS
jgi:hypothetical protein